MLNTMVAIIADKKAMFKGKYINTGTDMKVEFHRYAVI